MSNRWIGSRIRIDTIRHHYTDPPGSQSTTMLHPDPLPDPISLVPEPRRYHCSDIQYFKREQGTRK